MKVMFNYFSAVTSVIAVFFVSSLTTKAQTVTWGTSFSQAGPLVYDSAGNPDVTQQFSWHIGYFNAGFTPTASNALSWAANWNAVNTPGNSVGTNAHVDNASDPGTVLWEVSVSTTPAVVPSPAFTLYVFAYNDLAAIGTPTGQALLYTENLPFPPILSTYTIDIADGPTAEDDNFTLVWGRVDRNMLANGGIMTAADSIFGSLVGEVTAADGFGRFEAQFGGWAVPIPEPSTSLLSFLGATLAVFRRRRS